MNKSKPMIALKTMCKMEATRCRVNTIWSIWGFSLCQTNTWK